MEKGVTSDPVPEVVGTATRGTVSFRKFPDAISASDTSPSCRSSRETAFPASSGEPPPTATTMSAPKSRAFWVISRTHSTVGLLSTRLYTENAVPCACSTEVISPRAPLFSAETPSVTTIARFPKAAISAAARRIQPSHIITRTGIRNSKFMIHLTITLSAGGHRPVPAWTPSSLCGSR